ncbi:hypothetical protein PybrP1_000809 [[Pythium] brassicae (nom. inval.)]|nr:hypothetical protein PybrP1_000809 [[Pythium] brassicae (nom. inval.)]
MGEMKTPPRNVKTAVRLASNGFPCSRKSWQLMSPMPAMAPPVTILVASGRVSSSTRYLVHARLKKLSLLLLLLLLEPVEKPRRPASVTSGASGRRDAPSWRPMALTVVVGMVRRVFEKCTRVSRDTFANRACNIMMKEKKLVAKTGGSASARVSRQSGTTERCRRTRQAGRQALELEVGNKRLPSIWQKSSIKNDGGSIKNDGGSCQVRHALELQLRQLDAVMDEELEQLRRTQLAFTSSEYQTEETPSGGDSNAPRDRGRRRGSSAFLHGER